MLVKVLYFASSREIIGQDQDEFEFDRTEVCVDTFMSALLDKRPQLNTILTSSLLAVNMEYVSLRDPHVLIRDGDEVAVIPPVSGG